MSAPSFSSFPPTFASFPELDPGPRTHPISRKEKEKDRDEERKRHKRHKGEEDDEAHGERRKRHRAERHRERSDSKGAQQGRSRSRSRIGRDRHGFSDDERRKREEDRSYRSDSLYTTSAKEGLMYFTDRKGDPLNVRYGGLHTGDVPKYRLIEYGRKILGLSPALSVVHRGRGGIEVGPFGRRKMPALTDSGSRHMLSTGPTRRLLASSEDKYKFREIDGFLRITTMNPHKDGQPYRDIEPPKQSYDSDDSELSEESASSDDDSDTIPLTSLQSKLKSLEEMLVANPQDVSTWLSLLSHTLSTVPITSKNATKARAEITLPILKRALSAHPNNGRSKMLRLKYLQAGEELWQSSRLSAEWEEAVKVDDIEIWMAWLDWRVRNTINILESLVDDFMRIARALISQRDEVGLLRIQWRAAVALRDAGYIERANALFQAQAELLFFVPSQLSGRSLDDQLDGLEEFWDSEVPRVGEPGASGWAAWEASNRAEQPPPPTRKCIQDDSHVMDLYSKWAASEAAADRTQPLSLRSTDDDERADPYAVVLFSDIRPFLLPLATRQAKDTFRRIWLSFVGMHVPGFVESLSQYPGDNSDDRWACSPLVSTTYLASVFPAHTSARRIAADAHAGVLVGREREYRSGFGPVKDWGYETIAPLDMLGGHKWMMWNTEDVYSVDTSLIREILKHCRLGGDGCGWDMLNLAFEAAVGVKGALKVSKSLLANVRDSLPHWAAHARLECLRGRLDDARKVYQTVLNASSQNRPDEAELWWDWAQMEWLAGNEDVAQQVIIRSSRVAGSGGIAILRAKRHFETLLTQQLPRSSWREREAWIKISGLLELLTASPQSALALFDSYLNSLEHGTPAHESLLVASSNLLYNHAMVLKNTTPPALLRDRVERAIEVYPNNTAILGMFLEAQKGQGIWGRVRAILGEAAANGYGKEKGIARRVAEVWVAGWEKGRWEAEIERIRSMLAAAVDNYRTRGSAILWKLFVTFEIRSGQPERAKKLLFRAVGECPFVKELYLLAFGPLRAVFSRRELNQWADTMAERGVRMRVGLDEMVGDWTDKGEGRLGDGEEGEEDEIEYNARELRRLMPY